MSTYEKIATVIIGTVVMLMAASFSYNEIREKSLPIDGNRIQSGFDRSVGQDLVIGTFATLIGTKTSGILENDCAPLQPVLIAALHDIKEHLEHWGNPLLSLIDGRDAFEVSRSSLDTLCYENAEITLRDKDGNTLLLQKKPFTRAIPSDSSAADVGTRVHIDATIITKGTSTSTQPTTYADVLIPDRYLDAATAPGSR